MDRSSLAAARVIDSAGAILATAGFSRWRAGELVEFGIKTTRRHLRYARTTASWGVKMMTQVRRVPLIFSALLGALVISCASPPVYVVAPAPAAAPLDAPAPRGGLQEARAPAEPQAVTPPAPQVIPAPAVPPAQAPVAPPKAAPVAPPGRPGGAPPGTEMVTVPGGNVPLDEWKDGLAQACDKAHAGQSCLKLDINYKDKDGNKLPKKGTYTNCEVESQKPQMGAHKPVDSSVHLEVSCDAPAEQDTSDGSKSTGTGTGTHPDTTSKGTGTGDRSDDTKNHRGK
jgi:hypothetical protein